MKPILQKLCRSRHNYFMTITMNDSHLVSIAHLQQFNQGASLIQFQGKSREEKYTWIKKVLTRFHYHRLIKKKKAVLRTYLMNITGYSSSQLTRLIARHKQTGDIAVCGEKRHRFPTTYTPEDIALLGETDLAHERLSGPATKEVLQREYEEYGKEEYMRLKNISASHIYNLRATRQYCSRTKYFTKTKPAVSAIGERRKPDPRGKPGYIRVDTVHQGDLGNEKGVYHINLVDEVTQWEVVIAVEKISEQYLAPVLEQALEQFPFQIINFHSDNGSEFINAIVAKLLNKLNIQQTKSRPRHANDNGLVETKNGAIVRKHFGYSHISQEHAGKINQFYRERFNVYLNYHRPCGFATIKMDHKGKQKKVYDTYQTPYERFKSLRSPFQALNFLKPDVSWEELRNISLQMSDTESAKDMQKAKQKVFQSMR